MSIGDSQRLEKAILSARDAARALSAENQARLAQLMTVWASGYLEAMCRDVLRAYAEQRADPGVARFVSHSLTRSRSPRMENIVELVRSFDKNRASELENFAEGAIKGKHEQYSRLTESNRSRTPNGYICWTHRVLF